MKATEYHILPGHGFTVHGGWQSFHRVGPKPMAVYVDTVQGGTVWGRVADPDSLYVRDQIQFRRDSLAEGWDAVAETA